ncbi:hypothetical protein F5888DRAFT_1637261 [Russula emetica]|nr:hypothetical protein F5888DRAFT_1637261 [Russula emetica]
MDEVRQTLSHSSRHGQPPHGQDDVGNSNTQWLAFLRLFTAAENLIVPVMQELVGVRMTEVLPALQNIFLKGFQPSGPLEKVLWCATTLWPPYNRFLWDIGSKFGLT